MPYPAPIEASDGLTLSTHPLPPLLVTLPALLLNLGVGNGVGIGVDASAKKVHHQAKQNQVINTNASCHIFLFEVAVMQRVCMKV